MVELITPLVQYGMSESWTGMWFENWDSWDTTVGQYVFSQGWFPFVLMMMWMGNS